VRRREERSVFMDIRVEDMTPVLHLLARRSRREYGA
jgi:hypothetical protein